MLHFIYCYAECRYVECHFAACRYAECLMLSFVMLSVVAPFLTVLDYALKRFASHKRSSFLALRAL